MLFIFLQGRAADTTEAATSVVTETVDLEPSTSPPPEKKPFMTQAPSTKSVAIMAEEEVNVFRAVD